MQTLPTLHPLLPAPTLPTAPGLHPLFFRRAAWLVSEGHAGEAAALMRAAGPLERMREAVRRGPDR